MKKIQVYSEIGKLNKVFVHRLGKEVEGLVPNNFERLLFDDIPYLNAAQCEHDCFADVLRENGVEVLYLTDQLEKAMINKEVKEEFISEFLIESEIRSEGVKASITEYLLSMPTKNMVEKMLVGIKKEEITIKEKHCLEDIISETYPYYCDPMPNLYFTRDPAAAIGNGVSIHSMHTKARRREAICMKYMHGYNKNFLPQGTPAWYGYDDVPSIEGGDILVLSNQVVAVGCSDRSYPFAIGKLAENLLVGHSGFKKVLVFEIPKCRAFMHLDTVFTMVDYDKFTIHPEIEAPLKIFEITLGKKGELEYKTREDILINILKKELNLPAIKLIRCGGNDKLAAQREQWSDGSNTLAIAPGVVITYDRNYVTNELLDREGVKVLTIPSSELSRGRGGPRCMSMPIHRDLLD